MPIDGLASQAHPGDWTGQPNTLVMPGLHWLEDPHGKWRRTSK
jgi:hypothetical protein